MVVRHEPALVSAQLDAKLHERRRESERREHSDYHPVPHRPS
jgi:hypothetical protein